MKLVYDQHVIAGRRKMLQIFLSSEHLGHGPKSDSECRTQADKGNLASCLRNSAASCYRLVLFSLGLRNGFKNLERPASWRMTWRSGMAWPSPSNSSPYYVKTEDLCYSCACDHITAPSPPMDLETVSSPTWHWNFCFRLWLCCLSSINIKSNLQEKKAIISLNFTLKLRKGAYLIF